MNPSSERAYRFFQQRRQRQQNVYQQVKTIYYSVYYFKKKVLTWRLLLVKIMGTVYYIQPPQFPLLGGNNTGVDGVFNSEVTAVENPE